MGASVRSRSLTPSIGLPERGVASAPCARVTVGGVSCSIVAPAACEVRTLHAGGPLSDRELAPRAEDTRIPARRMFNWEHQNLAVGSGSGRFANGQLFASEK